VKKTYAESERMPPFDWNEFLNSKRISQSDWQYAKDLAEDWVTCACGNQCEIIPRYDNGEPKDNILYELGIIFSKRIKDKNKSLAKKCLAEIEERSAILIQEIIKNKLKELKSAKKEIDVEINKWNNYL